MPQTELTQSPKAAPGPRATMSAYEIDQRMSQFRDLDETIKTVREDERKLKAALQQVASKEVKAQRLLTLTEGVAGFTAERDHAHQVIEQYAEEMRNLNSRIEGLARRIKSLEEQRNAIDQSWFSRREEIRKLAHELGSA